MSSDGTHGNLSPEAVARERERWFSDPEDNAYWEEEDASMERGDPRRTEFFRAVEWLQESLRPGQRLEFRPGEGIFFVADEDDAGEEDDTGDTTYGV